MLEGRWSARSLPVSRFSRKFVLPFLYTPAGPGRPAAVDPRDRFILTRSTIPWRRASMKKSRISMLLLSLSVSASMLLTACGGETAATSTPATTGGGSTGAATATTATGDSTRGGSSGVDKIAVDLPVSGAEASDGVPTRNGIQLAIDQANKAGGVTIDGKAMQLQMYFLDDVPPGGQAHD